MTEKKYTLSLHGQAIEGGGTAHESLKDLEKKLGKGAKVSTAVAHGYKLHSEHEAEHWSKK
jgi:hypothetical protein